LKIIEKERKISIRPIYKEDLPYLWEISYKDNLKWMDYDGPYFNDPIYKKDEFIEGYGTRKFCDNPLSYAIIYNDKIVGIVCAYYKDGLLKNWLEFGIDIYDDKLWNLGIGFKSSKLFIQYLFDTLPIRRVGFSTWSGNLSMMKLGEKLGFKKEAQIRQVRFWNDEYYDSIEYGILREEWKS